MISRECNKNSPGREKDAFVRDFLGMWYAENVARPRRAGTRKGSSSIRRRDGTDRVGEALDVDYCESGRVIFKESAQRHPLLLTVRGFSYP